LEKLLLYKSLLIADDMDLEEMFEIESFCVNRVWFFLSHYCWLWFPSFGV